MRFAAQQAMLIVAGGGLIALPMTGTVEEIVLRRNSYAASEIPLFRGYGVMLVLLVAGRFVLRRAWVTDPDGWLGQRIGRRKWPLDGRSIHVKALRWLLHVDPAGRDRDTAI